MPPVTLPTRPTEAPRDLVSTVRALRSEGSRCVAQVEAALAAIAAVEPEVGAFVEVLGDDALAEARAQDALHPAARRGLPLAGIPVGIKDIIDVAGTPTLCGSVLRAGHRADRDAPIVRILKDLGAIVIGKTETTQFATSDPSRTRNPWSLEHSPGGSSSGSAAGTAAGFCLAALGTQTGGSITRPASYCGVASYKGCRGAWPLEGVFPLGANLDHVGPMGRTVADVALVWLLVTSRLAPGSVPSAETAAEAIVDGTWMDRVAAPRLAVFEDYYPDVTTPGAWQSFERVLGRLEDAGATLDAIRMPASMSGMHDAHRVVMAVECAGVHRRDFEARPETYGAKVATLIEQGLATSAVAYREALAHQEAFGTDLRAVLEAGGSNGLCVTPSAPGAAPPLSEGSTGDSQFNVVWSFSGLPTCGLPSGLDEAGLPLGIQVGATQESVAQFQASAWCERVLAFPGL